MHNELSKQHQTTFIVEDGINIPTAAVFQYRMLSLDHLY